MLADVVTGVLVDVIAATGRRLGGALMTLQGRKYREDLELARWFDTYRLTDGAPELPELPGGVTAGMLAEVLRGDEFHAVLHELLAARLTDAPEADVDRVRGNLRLTLGATFLGADIHVLADALFGYYDSRICELTHRLERANPGLLSRVRQEALAARTIAVLHAIERHAAALTVRTDPQADTDFITRYCRHVIDHHGKLEPPDFERRRRVPIADLYVAPLIIQVLDGEPAQPPREVDLWAFARDIDRTVLLGDPGGGKTSASHVLMHHYARAAGRRVPFMVILRDFAAEDPPTRSVAGHIEHRLETFYQCRSPAGLVERLLLSGTGVVIFDGLDELVDTARRAEVTAIVERFAAEYPLTRILVTSRVVGYDQARLDERQFVRYRISGFDEGRVGEYVGKWFSQDEWVSPADAESWAESFMAETAEVADLRSNPLMLALMCILYRGEGSVPRNRPEVFEQCSNLLFRKWDTRRRIHIELRVRYLVEPALRHLAFWLFNRSQAQAAVSETELIAETTRFLHGRGFESSAQAEDAAREFVEFCQGRAWVFSDTGTTAVGQRLYTFTHRTFLEYFAASYLAVTCDTPEALARTLAPHVARQEWEVVADLATQIKDQTSDRGAQRIMTALLTERRYRSVASRGHILEFLAHGLRFVDPPPQTVRELSREILVRAFDGDPDASARCHPVHQLLVSCGSAREVVKEEVYERACTLAASVDPAEVTNGLRLAVWVDDTNIIAQNHRVGLWGAQLWEFWNGFAEENVARYADAIISAGEDSPAMKYTALVRGLLSADDILRSEQPDMRALFNSQPTFFGIVGPPHLFRQVYELIRGRRKFRHSDPMAEFSAFGRFLLDHPDAPFVASPTGYGSFLANLGEPGPAESLPDPVSCLGASLTLLLGVEASTDTALKAEDNHRLGALNNLYPYLARRLGIEPTAELTALQLPRGFPELLKSWANREVDFVTK
jgi:hypothetical protein